MELDAVCVATGGKFMAKEHYQPTIQQPHRNPRATRALVNFSQRNVRLQRLQRVNLNIAVHHGKGTNLKALCAVPTDTSTALYPKASKAKHFSFLSDIEATACTHSEHLGVLPGFKVTTPLWQHLCVLPDREATRRRYSRP